MAVEQGAAPQTRLSHAQAELGDHLLRAASSEGGQAPLENSQMTAWVEAGAGVYQASPVEVGLVVPVVQERFHYSGVNGELLLQEKSVL